MLFAVIEALKQLKKAEFKNERPIEIAVFTGEEGLARTLTLLGKIVIFRGKP